MEIGYKWERKGYEYVVVAKVPHKNHEGKGVFVYLIEKRVFGEDDVEYITTIKN